MAEGSRAFEHGLSKFARCGLACPDHPVGKCIFCQALDVWRATEAEVANLRQSLEASAELQEISDLRWAEMIKDNNRLRAALRKHGIDPEAK